MRFNTTHRSIRMISLITLVLIAASMSLGQKAERPDRGVNPNQTYSVSQIESVNLSNGNLNLAIPLASLPPIAGGKLSWTVSAHYNSKLWNVLRYQQEEADLQWAPYVVDEPSADGGWIIGGQYVMQFRNSNEDFYRVLYTENSGVPYWDLLLLNNNSWWKVVLKMPDGSEHEFRPTDYSPYTGEQNFLKGYYNFVPNGSAKRYYSVDGTYMFARITSQSDWTVYMPDGTQIIQTTDGIQRIQDTNGNKIKIFSDGNGTHYQDEQTGREIRVSYNPSGNGGQGQTQVWYTMVYGGQQHIDINWKTTTVQGKVYTVNDWDYGAESVCERTNLLNWQLQVVDKIILPQSDPQQTSAQRQLSFEYNSDTTESASDVVNWTCNGGYQNYNRAASKGWGEVSKMTLPSGAIVNYAYWLDGNHALLFSTDDLARQFVAEKKVNHDGIDDTWTYNVSDTGGGVFNPDGRTLAETKYCANPSYPCYIYGKTGLAYRSVEPFKKTERHWVTLTFSGASVEAPGNGAAVTLNPVVDFEYTTLLDAGGNALKMSAKAFQYDYNGNVTQIKDYDWFDPSLVSRDSQGVPTGIPASATLLRTTNNSYYNQAAGSTSGNVYAKRSVSTGTPLILNGSKETTLGPSIVRLSYDGQVYGVAPTAGNLTNTSVWDDVDNKWINTSNTYDSYGNIATTTDGRGKITQYAFNDATHANLTSVTVDPQNGSGTQTVSTAYDFSTGSVTTVTDANGQFSTINYTNQLLGAVDPFGRPGIAIGPLIGGINQHHRVTTTYLDASRQVIVSTDLNTEDDKLLKTRTTSDMLGRPILTEQTEDGVNYTQYSQQAFAQFGRITFSSSVKRTGSASNTDSWSRVTKDNAGRVIEVATFGGGTQPPATGTTATATGTVTSTYSGEFTTVADQMGKLRRSKTDALGRLVRVDEPDATNNLGLPSSPLQPTSYTYDAQGNLRKVVQGSQTRFFSYDSLSRLRRSRNPEEDVNQNLPLFTDPITGNNQWSIAYSYDDNGNLTQKIDARNISITYAYDALNRNTSVDYSNTIIGSPNVPDITRFYDGATNGKGRFWYSYKGGNFSVGSEVEHTAIDSYDAAGRPLVMRQLSKLNSVWGPTYQVSRVYNLAGLITSQIYPSNRTVSYTYDNAGRTSSFSGNLGDATNRTYTSGIIYSPLGGMTKEQFGTNTAVFNKLFYNSRGQLAEIRASTSYTGPSDDSWNRGAIINHYSDQCWGMCSGYAMPDNNGNLKKQDVYVPNHDLIPTTDYTMRWQQFDYDSLNRLNWVREIKDNTEQWKQQFTYDRFGNRTVDQTNTYGVGIPKPNFGVNTANNRLTAPGGFTMSYDSAGNLTADTYTGAGDRIYDAENRMTQAWGGNNQWQFYSYNADGQRTRRKIDGAEKWQVYGFDGELLAEYPANGAASSPEKEYGYRNGQLLVTAEPSSGGGGSSGNNSITLNGTSNYAEVPDSSSLNMTGSITMEAWIKLPSVSTTYQPIIDKGPTLGVQGGYDLYVTETGKARMDIYYGVYYAALIGNTTLSANAWHHVAGVYDGSQMRLYVDGQLDGSSSPGVTMTTCNVQLRIGKNNYLYGPLYFLGLIDEVRVSNAALYTGSSFTPSTSLTAGGSTKGLWKFDGQNVNDTSGNGNNGSLVSGAYSTDVPGGSQGAQQSVSWTNAAGVSVNGNNLTKTAVDNWGNAGASSTQSFASGDGYVEVTASETTTYRMIGLSNGDTNQDYTDIDFAAYLAGGNLCVYEAGSNRGCFGSFTTGDTIRVAVESGVVKYKKNGTVVYTSSVTPTYPLLVDSAIWSNGGTLNNAIISGNFGGSGGSGGVHWLVADQLGTPRMIFDQSGKLENVKRHDYLPFGEELFAGVSGRNATQGYGGGDLVRQQFTSKERDIETGLDYFEARYYASTQGRFTSVDPLLSSARTYRPESWNRYSYCYNNPLKYLDPDGRKVKPEDEKALQNIRNTLPENIRDKVKLDKNGFIDRKALNKIKSKDANFLDLKTMVNSSQIVEVATASSTVLPGETQSRPFSYQSVEAQRVEIMQKLTPEFGAEMAAQVASQTTVPSLFLGSTLTPDQSPTGHLRIELSDQTGEAATAPDSQMAETTAHEMFGHGLPSMQGKPYQHDNGGPVDHRIKQIQDRTRRNFPEQPTRNVVPPK